MPISVSQRAELTCPSCGAAFTAEVWTLVDAAERPDLAQALREGTLDAVACPSCGASGPAGAPLLYHDPARQRVYFAAPTGVPEHHWRARAQELLYLLVGELPEEARLPYLADVQVEQEVAGVRRAVLRHAGGERRVPPRPAAPARPPDARAQALAAHIPGLRVGAGGPPPPRRRGPPPAPEAPPPLEERLIAAIQALLMADTPAEFDRIAAEHPELAGAAAPAFAQLIAIAQREGERDVAAALRAARARLATRAAAAGDTALASAGLSDRSYQAVMLANSRDALLAACRDDPALLEPAAADGLSARAEAALDAGNEQLAFAIETRAEELAALRAELLAGPALLRAARALVEAADDDELAQVLDEHPALLTDAAQEALLGLAAGARAQGDDDLAALALERRAMVRRVRAGLERG
jgi:hypothetical protein